MLTRAEAQRAAMACRIAAHRAEQDAKEQEAPQIREIFENEARQYAALAKKLDGVK